MIFCEIDELFCSLMHSYLTQKPGRIFVDCGAGEALFERKMPHKSVLSIDLYEQTDKVPVILTDYRDFSFVSSMVPIFIRPCHAMQVHETIIKNLDKVDSFLYVSKPSNVAVDLIPDEYMVIPIFDE